MQVLQFCLLPPRRCIHSKLDPGLRSLDWKPGAAVWETGSLRSDLTVVKHLSPAYIITYQMTQLQLPPARGVWTDVPRPQLWAWQIAGASLMSADWKPAGHPRSVLPGQDALAHRR